MLPLIYTLCPRKERENRARAALRAVGLEERFFSHRSNEISGGQMQRVAIARALVNNPALILADEPTGNLDTATGEMVLETFATLREQGRTIVLITHEPDVAAHADRILYIRDGLMYDHPKIPQKQLATPDPRQRIILGSNANQQHQALQPGATALDPSGLQAAD
jgi:putative ABC transport system ATP-binding protein